MGDRDIFMATGEELWDVEQSEGGQGVGEIKSGVQINKLIN